MPIFIKVHYTNGEERLINVNNIAIVAQHMAHIVEGGVNKPESTTDIDFTSGVSMRNVRETPEEIYQMIKAAIQSTTQVVGNRLINMGWLK